MLIICCPKSPATAPRSFPKLSATTATPTGGSGIRLTNKFRPARHPETVARGRPECASSRCPPLPMGRKQTSARPPQLTGGVQMLPARIRPPGLRGQRTEADPAKASACARPSARWFRCVRLRLHSSPPHLRLYPLPQDPRPLPLANEGHSVAIPSGKHSLPVPNVGHIRQET